MQLWPNKTNRSQFDFFPSARLKKGNSRYGAKKRKLLAVRLASISRADSHWKLTFHRISHGRNFSCIPLDILENIIAYSNLDIVAWGHKYFVRKALVVLCNFHKFEMTLKWKQKIDSNLKTQCLSACVCQRERERKKFEGKACLWYLTDGKNHSMGKNKLKEQHCEERETHREKEKKSPASIHVDEAFICTVSLNQHFFFSHFDFARSNLKWADRKKTLG